MPNVLSRPRRLVPSLIAVATLSAGDPAHALQDPAPATQPEQPVPAEGSPALPPAAPPVAEPVPSLPAVPPAAAEVQAAPRSTANTPDALRAVVVTAQRREESIQKVPTAISVMDGNNLVDAGIGRSAREVLDYVPNASAGTQLHGRPRWWIRGVGTGQQQLDFSNPVGFYLDDVYISNASATGFPLFDLERVEVLRGPQGTLWGKNTTGGAVSVVSRKPSFEQNDGYLKLDYGSFNDKLVQGASNGIIWANRLAVRGAFHYESRDGRFRNLNNNQRAGEFQDGAARLQAVARITDELEATTNIHLRKYTTDGAITTTTGTGPGGTYRGDYAPSTDINAVSVNAPDHNDIQQTGALLNLRWQRGGYALTSISGYERYKEEQLSDSDNTPLEISRGWADSKSQQFSQEVRLTSPRDARISGVAGLFYFYESINRKNASGKLPNGGAPVPGPANYALTVFDHDTQSLAAFASTTVQIASWFNLTAGLRWTNESRELDIVRWTDAGGATFSNVVNWWDPGSVSSPLATVYDETPSKTWNNFTYDVTPTFDVGPDARLYFRFAHGIKSGGFNTAATNRAALNVVEPERLNAYELGAKTSWLSRRLTANLAGFHYDYRDIQINVVGPLPPTNTAVSYLQNVKRGRVNGAELELEALPF
ncbi:MAG TPA: TonB-dependent receptor, partial [Polyangia bacterium]